MNKILGFTLLTMFISIAGCSHYNTKNTPEKTEAVVTTESPKTEHKLSDSELVTEWQSFLFKDIFTSNSNVEVDQNNENVTISLPDSVVFSKDDTINPNFQSQLDRVISAIQIGDSKQVYIYYQTSDVNGNSNNVATKPNEMELKKALSISNYIKQKGFDDTKIYSYVVNDTDPKNNTMTISVVN